MPKLFLTCHVFNLWQVVCPSTAFNWKSVGMVIPCISLTNVHVPQLETQLNIKRKYWYLHNLHNCSYVETHRNYYISLSWQPALYFICQQSNKIFVPATELKEIHGVFLYIYIMEERVDVRNFGCKLMYCRSRIYQWLLGINWNIFTFNTAHCEILFITIHLKLDS